MKQYYSFLAITINLFFMIGLVFGAIIFFGDHEDEIKLFSNLTKTQIYVIFVAICSIMIRYFAVKFLKFLSDSTQS